MWSYVHNTFTLCVVLAALSVSSGLFTTFTQDLVRTDVTLRRPDKPTIIRITTSQHDFTSVPPTPH